MDQEFNDNDAGPLGQISDSSDSETITTNNSDNNHGMRDNRNGGLGQNPDMPGYVRFEDFEEVRRRLQEEMTRNDELRRERIMNDRDDRNLHDEFRRGRIVDVRNENIGRNIERENRGRNAGRNLDGNRERNGDRDNFSEISSIQE